MQKSSSMDPVQGAPSMGGKPRDSTAPIRPAGVLASEQRVLQGNHGLPATSAVGKIIHDGAEGCHCRLKLALLLPSDRAAAFLQGLI